jgi:hypothetical protein
VVIMMLAAAPEAGRLTITYKALNRILMMRA